MKIVLYSMNGCAQCVQASMLLTVKGVVHEVVKVDEDDEAYAFFKDAGHRSVPQVYLVMDDLHVHVGDYKRLTQFEDEDFAALK